MFAFLRVGIHGKSLCARQFGEARGLSCAKRLRTARVRLLEIPWFYRRSGIAGKLRSFSIRVDAVSSDSISPLPRCFWAEVHQEVVGLPPRDARSFQRSTATPAARRGADLRRRILVRQARSSMQR